MERRYGFGARTNNASNSLNGLKRSSALRIHKFGAGKGYNEDYEFHKCGMPI